MPSQARVTPAPRSGGAPSSSAWARAIAAGQAHQQRGHRREGGILDHAMHRVRSCGIRRQTDAPAAAPPRPCRGNGAGEGRASLGTVEPAATARPSSTLAAPRKRATKRRPGVHRSRAAGRVARCARPPTATRSASASASSWSCVTMTKAAPVRAAGRATRRCARAARHRAPRAVRRAAGWPASPGCASATRAASGPKARAGAARNRSADYGQRGGDARRRLGARMPARRNP